MAEVFVNIAEHPNYEVSNFGNVKNISTNKIINRTPNRMNVLLNGNCIMAIRRLVANAFVENPHCGYLIEVIDGDKSNAKSSNLRWIPLKNCRTRITNENNTSGMAGVSFSKQSQKWQVRISINKQKKYLGSFTHKDDAIKARQDAEIKHYPVNL